MKMNCHNCGASLVLDGYVELLECEYCDTLHLPTWKDEAESILLDQVCDLEPCPKCQKNMCKGRIGQCEMKVCSQCRGMLFEASKLMSLIVYLRKDKGYSMREPEPILPEDLKRRILCPECNEQMNVSPYYGPGNFVIDHCKNCRYVWLDGGELHKSVTVHWNGTLWN